jgi:hypothetical protein
VRFRAPQRYKDHKNSNWDLPALTSSKTVMIGATNKSEMLDLLIKTIQTNMIENSTALITNDILLF